MSNKQISQRFFDETVRDNMELLELSVDEAIDETFQSFTTEGVDLSSIVRDMVKYTKGHPCELALKRLCYLLECNPVDYAELLNCIQELKKLCDADLAHRKLLFSLGALDFLGPAISKCTVVSERRCLTQLLAFIEAFASDQPEIFQSSSGEKLFEALIQLFSESANLVEGDNVTMEVAAMLYAVFRVACIQNEPNRRVLAQSDVLSRTLALLSLLNLSSEDVDNTSKCLLVRHSCRFLRSMTLDDDMNVVFGLGSENARQIASTNAAMEIFLRLVRASILISNQRCLVDLFLALASVITREEFCTQFHDLGGIELVFSTLEEYIDSPVTLIQLFSESANLVEGDNVTMEVAAMLYAVFRVACIQNEPNRRVLAQSDVLSRTLALLSLLNLSSEDVDNTSKCLLVRHSCRFLRSMTLDDDMNVVFGLGSENARQIASTNAAMEIFLRLVRASILISNQRCLVDLFLALASVITREEFCTQFHDLGGIELVFSTLEEYIDSPVSYRPFSRWHDLPSRQDYIGESWRKFGCYLDNWIIQSAMASQFRLLTSSPQSGKVTTDPCDSLIQLFSESANLVEGDNVTMEVAAMLYAVFRVACIQNEPNRRVLAQSDVLSRTLALLSLLNLSSEDVDNTSKCLLVRHSCRFLRSMTLDDDMNVVFGLGSENARQIASTNAAMEIFLRLVRGK
ncbi:hypothetical protein AHF37_08038 [Paragonimus kellicotti]|nr:hypothetical protein AHF37_08038 [Paragonimus kellicotti]